MGSQEPINSTHPLNPPPDVDNKMAIEADPGPCFNLAAPEKLEAFGPVLIIFPDSGDINMVLVELSPLDVYYRERLRLDQHSMMYLSSVPSFEEMRRRGYSIQFYASKNNFVSDSFAILRKTTNIIVGTIMDQVMPASHNYSTQFKLLGHHGEYQEKRDFGNQAGALAKGTESTLGRAITTTMERIQTEWVPTPRTTNGGVKCFNELTGNEDIDSSREELRDYFGAQMDAVQLIVDKVREDHGYKRIYNDCTREEAVAAKLREKVNAKHSRAEVSPNFVILMDGNDGCSFHTDSKNCPQPSYDWTCCVATTVELATTGRLYRAVTNLNSRAACGRAMEDETKYSSFKLGLETEMERINSFYKEIYGDAPEVPTA
jgi:hypothetical protein